jgi:hypothetical protein
VPGIEKGKPFNPNSTTKALLTSAARKAHAWLESNWVPTDPARKFELMFRLYAPKKELFEKTWVLPDAEQVAA